MIIQRSRKEREEMEEINGRCNEQNDWFSRLVCFEELGRVFARNHADKAGLFCWVLRVCVCVCVCVIKDKMVSLRFYE